MARALRIPPRKRKWRDAEVSAWAAEHPEGTPVRYWSVRGDDAFIDATIRSEPWRLGNGEPIVKITGITGGVALDHLRKLPVTTAASQVVERALDRIDANVDEARSIAVSLSAGLREEYESCFPSGISVENRRARDLVALKLASVVCMRGQFSVDVQWTSLGRAVCRHLLELNLIKFEDCDG